MKFNLNDYDHDTVMHCLTEEEAATFCTYLHNAGRRWTGGDSYADITKFSTYGNKTCYYFKSDQFGSIKYAQYYNRRILNFRDFDWSDLAPPEEENPVALRFTW